MDRGKRAEEWPPAAAEIKKTKKQSCDCGPPATTTGSSNGTVPDEDLSSLFSSLSVAKRHRPSAVDDHHHHHHDKRPRPLHDQMRGLEISCDETDMEEESSSSIRPPHCRYEVDWSGFLPEMLWLICRRLPLADVPRFASVCKHWNSCAFSVYPADDAPFLLSTVVTGAGSVRCYHPCLHKMFVLATPPQTQGCRVFWADGNGCLMLRTARKTVMFINLLGDGAGSSVFETPQRENDKGFMCCVPREQHGDSDRPYDRRIFAVYPHMGHVKIQSWDGGSWKSFQSDGGFFTMSSSCNPVMHKGKLYCLGEEGGLGVYDPVKNNWRVLTKPAGFGLGIPHKNCYLVESQGELLAALTGSFGTPVHVLRLNEMKMEWERMESLGGRALFTGTTSSLSTAARPLQSMGNKVYLPKFYGRPQVIQAELASSGGRLFFVAKMAKEEMRKGDANSGGSAWRYDLESDFSCERFVFRETQYRPRHSIHPYEDTHSGERLAGSSCINLLKYMWVHLGIPASPTSDDGMVIG